MWDRSSPATSVRILKARRIAGSLRRRWRAHTLAPVARPVSVGRIAGKSFVLTGTLGEMAREAARDAIVQRGGKVSGSVSKKTDYLIAGADSGSNSSRRRASASRCSMRRRSSIC